MKKRRALVALLTLFVGLALLLTLWHPGRVAVKTLLLVPEIVPQVPVRPLPWFTAEPVREQVTYPTPTGQRSGLLFRPADGGPYPAVAFFLGVSPDLEDPILDRVLGGLARSGIVVLLPVSASMQEVALSPVEVEDLIGALLYLESLPQVKEGRVGYAGFSVGGSLALLAAADPRVRSKVAYVNAFGAYYDLHDLIPAVTTRTILEGDKVVRWYPQPLAAALLERGLINMLKEERDRRLLREVLTEDSTGESIPSMKVPVGLSEEGMAVYSLLIEEDPGRAREIVASLPPEIEAKLRALSPSCCLQEVQAPVFLLHDLADGLVSYVESRKMRDALTAAGKEVVHTETGLFEHVRPSARLDLLALVRETAKFSWHLYRVLLVAF